MSRRTSDWTPEESRYLDGEISAEEARRIQGELATDPKRAKRMELWRRAMGLWRDDVRRRAARVDTEHLADDVLEVVRRGATAGLSMRTIQKYVAAALLLMGLGVGGAAWLGPNPERTALLHAGSPIRRLEEDRLNHPGRFDWGMRTLPGARVDEKESDR